MEKYSRSFIYFRLVISYSEVSAIDSPWHPNQDFNTTVTKVSSLNKRERERERELMLSIICIV